MSCVFISRLKRWVHIIHYHIEYTYSFFANNMQLLVNFPACEGVLVVLFFKDHWVNGYCKFFFFVKHKLHTLISIWKHKEKQIWKEKPFELKKPVVYVMFMRKLFCELLASVMALNNSQAVFDRYFLSFVRRTTRYPSYMCTTIPPCLYCGGQESSLCQEENVSY